MTKACQINNCKGEHLAKGMCRKHYLRNYKHGSPYIKKNPADYAKKGKESSCFKHGCWNHPLYGTWNRMVSRCENPGDPVFERYGARGIKVCDRWLDIRNFIADMGDKPEGTSIDRIDNNKGYSPDNCRWADDKTQGRNRRCVKLSMEKAREIRALPRRSANGTGDGYTRKEIAEMYGVSLATIKKVVSGAYWQERELK